MTRRHLLRLLMLVVAVAALIPALRPALRSGFDVIADHEAQPVCHKQVAGVLDDWQTEHKTREFPNLRGESQTSLRELPEIDEFPAIKSHYNYVPGLTRDDPGDLVLMYVNQPTRWIWHGQTPTIFIEQAWILVPVDMKLFGNRDRDQLPPGECSERVPFDEFRARLEKTLKFLEQEKRPNWQTVVKEHSEFLKALGKKGQNAGATK